MDLEEEYFEYTAEFSLSLLAVSAAYFFDPLAPVSYGTLLLVPLLFGYTAYVSRDGFRSSSFLGFIALVFAALEPVMAVMAVVISAGNVLVSVFAGGEHFHDYFHATTIPLIITGILVGSGIFVVATTQPGTAGEIRATTAGFMASATGTALNRTGIMGQQKKAQKAIVFQTSKATVEATGMYVLNRTDLGKTEAADVSTAFESARRRIPSMITRKTGSRMPEPVDVSETVSSLVKSYMDRDTFVLAIPLLALMFYSLQPVVGILTAISAYAFSLIGED